MFNSSDVLDYFTLTIDNQKPIIRDLILICIRGRPNSVYDTVSQTNTLAEEIIM